MSDRGSNPSLSSSSQQTPRVAAEVPDAESRKGKSTGWIWSIPIAAGLIVGWLAFRQLTAEGTLVTVVFPQADGISANQTAVVYHGLTVGKVESVQLESDLRHVRTKIRIVPELEGHLGEGTEFWIETPSFTDLTSLRAIIAGPSIGIAPVTGKKQSVYDGFAQAPVTPVSAQGTHYVLRTAELGTVARGSKIYFHGLEVGAVDDVALEPDHHFRIRIFVKRPYDRLVHQNTRFWNSGAVQVSLGGAGPRLQMQSLPALFSGAIDFETPNEQGARSLAYAGFTLYGDKSAADFAPGPFAVTYRAVFGPSAGGLAEGASVTLAGIRVGTVEKATFRPAPESGALREDVLFAIEPSRIGLANNGATPSARRAATDALITRLIARGLRAEPGSSVPLVGAQTVALTFDQSAPSAALIAGNPPEIPAAHVGSGSGIAGVVAAVDTLTSELESLPIQQIADNIQTVTARAAALAASHKLQESLADLEGAAANLKAVSGSAKTDIPAVLQELRRIAREASGTVASAHALVNAAAGTGPAGLNTASVPETLYQINRAAAAIRELVQFLDRHPSALIRGRQ